MAVCQLQIYWLTHRYREQAPSHILICVLPGMIMQPALRRGCAQSNAYILD